MSNFPNSFDDDATLPAINNNLTELGGEAINALRDFAFNTEQYLGLGGAGTTSSISTRLAISINPDGSIKASAIASMGLVTLPITQDQIAPNAGIPESKLTLDHRTQDLFNYTNDLSKDINLAVGWIAISGIKLEPHLIGAIYRHDLNQIDVSSDTVNFPLLDNKFRALRDNSQSYNLINDINNELLAHQWNDGSPFGTIQNVVTNNGSVYPSNYSHVSSGIFLNTSRFQVIPQTAQDMQSFAEFIDSSSILLLGTRLQNLYSNGISRVSRSSSLLIDGYGPALVPITPAIAYLKNTGTSGSPVDDIDTGDDIIEFKPTNTSNNLFDEQFALVRVGDIVRVNYGGIEVKHIIVEKKYIQNGGNKKFLVRIGSKNIQYAANASARIDRTLVNNNKFGVLATAASNGIASFSGYPATLIIGSSRGAQALGRNFSPDQFDEQHYLLYLALYSTGSPSDGYTILPAIDVTGNQGTTPSSYTLDSIIEATNDAFRQPGFNYRFIAFKYQGEFGIMLADSYNNSAFSIVSAVVSSAGFYDTNATHTAFPNNVIDLFPSVGTVGQDPLGFGPFGANVASPPFMGTYGSPQAAIISTQLFVPLKRNNYYINGTERERLNLDIGQALDTFGDGYWVGTIANAPVIIPGPNGRVQTTYTIPLDLSASQLKKGKTIVVQSLGQGSLVDFGRFIITNITFECSPAATTITVYDAVHAFGSSPTSTLGQSGVGQKVAIYFDADTVSFNAETATDFTAVGPFKRHFEVYIDENSTTFSHERGRIFVGLGSGSPPRVNVNDGYLFSSTLLGVLDIVRISPKLRGYQFGSINKIALNIVSFDGTSGIYSGFLASTTDGIVFTRQGPTISGKKGEITRFYDETNIDFIDILFDINAVMSNFTNQVIDLQLFPTLALDDEVMLISSCQLNDVTQTLTQLLDQRQFGNTSEKEFSTSALNFISAPERLLHFNGILRGFELVNITGEFISLTGGLVLVNGNLVSVNDQITTIPKVQETYLSVNYPINWGMCVNSGGEIVLIPLTDFDAVLGTPNAPTRLFTAFNAFSSTTYPIDANTFSYLLNDRKDLTLLYIISATVVGTGTFAHVSSTASRDVRRFINDGDSSLPAVLTNDNSQGNFKTLAAALNWLKFNSSFQNTLQIKGNYTLTSDPGLNFTLNVIGGAALSSSSLTFTSAMNISNVSFDNVSVIFSSTLIATNVSFKNCDITFQNSFNSLSELTFDNCTINNNNLTISDTVFRNCTFNTSVVQGFTLGSDTIFDHCTFNYTANPIDIHSYDATDLVNAQSGLIYANVSVPLNNVEITNCSFNSTLANHFPFISLQLTAYSSIAENIKIDHNLFTSTLSAVNDVRAVVALTSTLTSPASGGAYPKLPKLVNVNIDHNMCNYDQMIVLSTNRITSTAITGAMLSAVNCTISYNTCGTIGFITAGDGVSRVDNSNNSNAGLVRNKEGQLLIHGNSCKLITNLDARGSYIPFRATTFPTDATDWVQTGTGAYTISNNSVNWIQVGCASYSTPFNNGAIISDNRISPADSAFLTNYTDALNSGLTPSNVALLLRRERNTQGDARSIISNNVIHQKPVLETSGSTTTFYYDAGLVCFNNAIITGNIVNGVLNSSTAPMVYLGATGEMRISNNILNRNSLDIQAYVVGQVGATNRVNIVDNTFDSQFIDAANTTEISGLNIPSSWEFFRNVNQIYYLEFPVHDELHITLSPSFAGTFGDPTIVPVNAQQQIDTANSGNFVVGRENTSNSIYGVPSAQYLQLDNLQTSGTYEEAYYAKWFGIDWRIPANSRLLSVKLGAWLRGPNSQCLNYATPSLFPAGSTHNCITLSLLKYANITTSNSVNGVLDIKANAGACLTCPDNSNIQTLFSNIPIANSTQETNIKNATQYASIDLTAQDYRSGQNYRIAISVDVSFLKDSAQTDMISLFISPVVVKCIYGA